MQHQSHAKHLFEDALSAAILLTLCVVIVWAPLRAPNNASAAPTVVPLETTSPKSEMNSIKHVVTQRETNELTD